MPARAWLSHLISYPGSYGARHAAHERINKVFGAFVCGADAPAILNPSTRVTMMGDNVSDEAARLFYIYPHRGQVQVGLEVGFPATGGRVGGRGFWAKRGINSVWEVGSAVGSEVGSFGCGQEPEVTGGRVGGRVWNQKSRVSPFETKTHCIVVV